MTKPKLPKVMIVQASSLVAYAESKGYLLQKHIHPEIKNLTRNETFGLAQIFLHDEAAMNHIKNMNHAQKSKI